MLENLFKNGIVKFILKLTSGIIIMAIGNVYFNNTKNLEQPKNVVNSSTVKVIEKTKTDSEEKSNYSEKKQIASVTPENFNSYINTSIKNSSEDTSYAITIVDEYGNISLSISSSISNIYKQSGNIGHIGLLKSSFVHKNEFQELFEGNSIIIEKLKLDDYIDYLVLGKIEYSMKQGKLVEGTLICTASISISIISANQKSITQSFSFSVNGNGVSESQAKEIAIQKLINKYNNEYLSL